LIVATLARLQREGYEPRRDIVLALTGDEETRMVTTRALAEDLRGAEFALNGDAGGGTLDATGRPLYYSLQASEKTYVDFEASIESPGGHSARPGPDNAIYQLARALTRLNAHRFPARVNEVTRASLALMGQQVGGELGAAMTRFAVDPGDDAAAALISQYPEYVGQIRTTCVATQVEAGHARNALPQRATANINCRIFPGVSIDTVTATLIEVLAEPGLKLKVLDHPVASDASPLRSDVTAAVTKAVHARHPGLPIIPTMSVSASDSLHFRAAGIPSYGVGAIFIRPQDSYSHGLNERVPIDDIDAALQQWYTLLVELTR
jgi:acetylornithine deacetylase/succinyl-diaminopimelate desuccinylase-like protein